jgi:hypothetical protein
MRGRPIQRVRRADRDGLCTPWPPALQPRAPVARPSSCTSPHSVDKRRSNETGAKEAGSNGRGGGQTIRALCAQSGSCTASEIGGSAMLKLPTPRAVNSTPSRRRYSPGGAEPLMREIAPPSPACRRTRPGRAVSRQHGHILRPRSRSATSRRNRKFYGPAQLSVFFKSHLATDAAGAFFVAGCRWGGR